GAEPSLLADPAGLGVDGRVSDLPAMDAVAPARHDDEVRRREQDGEGQSGGPQTRVVRGDHEPEQLDDQDEDPSERRLERPEGDGSRTDCVRVITELHDPALPRSRLPCAPSRRPGSAEDPRSLPARLWRAPASRGDTPPLTLPPLTAWSWSFGLVSVRVDPEQSPCQRSRRPECHLPPPDHRGVQPVRRGRGDRLPRGARGRGGLRLPAAAIGCPVRPW